MLAAPRRPGSPAPTAASRVWERPVGWPVLSCPNASLVLSQSPHPTPALAQPVLTDPLVIFRWLDVILVVLAAPFVILTGLPVLGYAVGAAGWILNRVIGVLVERRASAEQDVRRAVGLNLGALIARSWLVGLTILAVGLAGEREDGLMAAILILAAFTLYFVSSLLLRSLERNTPRP